jgi:beta-glucosidase
MLLFAVIAVLAGPADAAEPGAGADTMKKTSSGNGTGTSPWSEVRSPLPADDAIEARVSALLERMTLEEKVGQIIQADIRYASPDEVRQFHLGSILSGGGAFPDDDRHASAADWLAKADAYYDASVDASDGGTAVPIMWGIDAVHGHGGVFGATVFPHNIALGATRNPDLVREIGAATAREVAATGLDWTFAPTLAVAQDRRWGRSYESFSEDPELVATLGQAAILGLQGDPADDTFLGPGRILATAKHFVGDGGTERGRDQGDTRVSEAELATVHGAGHVAAIKAGVQTIMATYNSWNGRKVHGETHLLTDVLRHRLGFDGLVIGDWDGHAQIPGCSKKSCPDAINAGIDMIMVPGEWRAFHANTVQQVQSGVISEERLNEAVRRILRVKVRAGLFESGRPSERPLAGQAEWLGHPSHRALARQAVRESLVLLKNTFGLLPLSPSAHILITGEGATTIAQQVGGWTMSWQGEDIHNEDFPGATSLYQAFADAADAAGGKAVLSPDGTFGERPDVAIVVFGEGPYAEMRGDLDDLAFGADDPSGFERLESLKQAGIPTVAVFLTGRPRWTNPELNRADAFVVAWQPGSEGGGVADVLLRAPDGRFAHDFRGRLPFSWPATAEPDATRADGSAAEPLFPAGYGLSYAESAEVGVVPEDGGPQPGVPEPTIALFRNGRAAAPFRMMVGDGADWDVAVYDSGAEPLGGQPLGVDAFDGSDPAGTGRRVRWAGGPTGRLSLATLVPVDLSAGAEGTAQLHLSVRVEAPPAGRVMLGSCDEDGCDGPLDIGDLLRQTPAGETMDVRIDLRCLVSDPERGWETAIPFRLSASGAMTLDFQRIAIERTDAPLPAEPVCPGPA